MLNHVKTVAETVQKCCGYSVNRSWVIIFGAIFANNTAPHSSNFGNEMTLISATPLLEKIKDKDPFMDITHAYKSAIQFQFQFLLKVKKLSI